MLYLLALLIGVIAGLRAMTAPLAISLAAHFDWLDLSGSVLAFLGSQWTVVILLVLAIGELITDQLPSTPSRKVPIQFGTRILMGAVTGGAIGVAVGSLWIGAIIGAVAGGGKGAAIGAGVGAGGATAVQVLTKGEKLKIPSETKLEFTLRAPLVVAAR